MSTSLNIDSSTLLVDGQWRAGDGAFDVLDPATLDVVGEAAEAGPDAAADALEAACRAFPRWRATDAEARGELIRRGASRIRARLDELALLMSVENGKPIREARGEVLSSARMLEWAAEEGRRANGRITPAGARGPGLVLLAPVGPVLAITPWNFPGSMLVRKVGLALAAGCPIIVKPAEQTPLIAAELVRLIAEDLPPGVLQLLTTSRPGDLSKPLLADPRLRKLSFTGSTEVGLRLLQSTSTFLRRASLEMGGHSPAIVFADADVATAAQDVVNTKFANSGQSCISINRLFVDRAIHDDFLDAVQEKVRGLRVGLGRDEATDIGPLIDSTSMDKVERHVRDAVDKGATATVGGTRWQGDDPALRGAFFEPTVLTGVDETMQVDSEETFGPVLPVYVFDEEDEVVARANSTHYGLAAYVWTSDVQRSWRVMDALDFGIIGVNEPFPVRPELPFGGMKNSGLEREGGSEGIGAYLEPKAVSLHL